MKLSAWALGLAGILVGTGCVGDAPRARIGEGREPLDHAGWRAVTDRDFNRDGMADVLWDDRTSNRVELWLMQGARILARGPAIAGPPGEGWMVVPAGDFNGDGLGDLLWSDIPTKRAAVWLMNGTQLLARGPEMVGPPGEGWRARTGVDFNRDGMDDVLWTNPTTNEVAVWLMNGVQVVAAGPEIAGPPGEGWLIATYRDFNGDGLIDLAWVNTRTNRLTVWLMNGTQVLAPGPEIPGPPGEGWTVVPTGDFNRDGMWDVLWDNRVTNRVHIWLMNGTQVLAAGPEIAGPPGEGWRVIPCNDTNGDGMADLAWNDPAANQLAIWLMNGTQVVAHGAEIAGPSD